ncbi:MAG: hypothetical protein KDC95_09760 [Planctomycetes bacterium]|nr:hypothetical protein [Planctomycetota bacterium]
MHRCSAAIGPIERETFELESGLTLGEAIEKARLDWPADLELQVLVNGAPESDRQRRLVVGDDVVLAPSAGVETVLIISALAFASVISYYISAFFAPKPPVVERGDDRSPTYGWQGVQTNFGPGAPIPLGYGEMRIGTQALSSRTLRRIGSRWTDNEVLAVALGLGSGPIHAIGGIVPDACGEADNLGGSFFAIRPLPAGVRINGTEIATDDRHVIAHIRTGLEGQNPIPNGFDDVSTLYALNSFELKRGDERIYTTASDEVDRLLVDFRFSRGLYQYVGGREQPFPVEFVVEWRKVGETAWGAPKVVKVSLAEPAFDDFSHSELFELPEVGEWQLRFRRQTNDDNPPTAAGDYTISESEIETITEQRLTSLAYPDIAILALEIEGNERFQGTLQSVSVPVQQRTVHRWEEGAKLPREWARSSDPSKITARNVAWVLADFLTDPIHGAGSEGVIDSDLILSSFEGFADYCDQPIEYESGKTEPRHQIDLIFDQVADFDEMLQQIASVGRAAVIQYGSQWKVVWDHVKERSMLLTGDRIDDLQLRYINASRRPTKYSMQISDRDIDWDTTDVPVEDVEAMIDVTSLNRDRLTEERVSGFGITRKTAARRELLYRHRSNALRDLEVTFTVSGYALPLEIFDRFAVSSQVPQWYARWDTILEEPTITAEAFVARTREAALDAPVTHVTLDRDVTLGPLGQGLTWSLMIQARTDDAEDAEIVEIREIGAYAGVAKRGTQIAFQGAPLRYVKDAQVVIGISQEMVVDFTVTQIEYDPERFEMRVSGIKYDENAYELSTEEGASFPLTETQESTPVTELVPALAVQQRATPFVDRVSLTMEAGGEHHVIRWRRPVGDGYRFRVYLRHAGDDRWSFLEETSKAQVRVQRLASFETYEISVVARDARGVWGGPEKGAQITAVAGEFPDVPPPNVLAARAGLDGRGIVIAWDDVNSRSLDYYEVRRGMEWEGGDVLARSKQPRVLIPDGRIAIPNVLTGVRGEFYWIRARARNGLYSPVPLGAQLRMDAPQGYTLVNPASWQIDSLFSLGTASGCVADLTGFPSVAPSLVFLPEAYEATYTLPEVDLTTSMWRWLSNAAGWTVRDATPVSELAMLGPGEMHWFDQLAGRPPSYARPGADFVVLDTATDEGLLQLGRAGVLGSNVKLVTEVRIYDPNAAAWGPWVAWTSGFVIGSKFQARIRMHRRALSHVCAVRYLLVSWAE